MKVITKNGPVEMDEENILTNDVVFQHEYNPHNVRPWLIGNEFGPICIVWGSCEQGALDTACDEDQMESFLVEEESEKDMEYTYLGNASEPHDISNLWMEVIDLSKQELPFLLKLAEARGATADNLWEV